MDERSYSVQVSLDPIDSRFGAPGRLVLSSLTWTITAIASATSICFLGYYFYALFFIRFMIAPALVLGALHSTWLFLERRHFAEAREASVFAMVSGGFIGVLGLAAAFANVTDMVFGRGGIGVLIAASVIGGAIAGRTAVRFLSEGEGG